MATRERPVDRGRARGLKTIRDLGKELRGTRIAAGLSQDQVGLHAGLSGSQVGRIERGEALRMPVRTAAVVAAVLGLELVVRTYPAGSAVRDTPQLGVLGRFCVRLGAAWLWRYEVVVRPGDQRAWDATIRRPRKSGYVAIEAETRIEDVQALIRRISQKRDAGGGVRIVLLVADTRHNRAVLAAAADVFEAEFPIRTREALTVLVRGDIPEFDAVVVL